MNYPPKHHQETNFRNVKRTIAAYPLATIISAENNVIHTTHLPLIFKSGKVSKKLIGHIDRENPQSKMLAAGKPCTIIFHGPQTYISPSIYSTPQLPTWNYVKVHIEGNARHIEDSEAVKKSIVEMTKILEGVEQRFILSKDDDRMHRLIDYIVGFEIDITSWEGKFKLSQDKNTVDQMAAKSALVAAETSQKTEYINSIYDHHERQR